ncbi:MAG: hypothetical protein ACI8S6_003911 [Myxococcota bacterium]|jgi:hypothetical protein
MDDPIKLLDNAVAAALAKGFSCSGWMVQRDGAGFVAWLYVTDEAGRMLSLMDEVDDFPTFYQAARWCLAVVEGHGEE